MFTLHFKRYLQIFIGCLICGVGINSFLLPAQLLASGLGGIAIIIYYILALPIGMQLLVFNIPIVYLAYRVFGKLYAFDTIIGTAMFSVCVDAMHFLSTYALSDSRMLNSIFGGVLCGIGYGIIFRAESNTGGFDVVGAVIKKFYSFNVGSAIFVLNLLVILSGMLMFDVSTGLLTLIATYASAEMTDKVVAGFNRKKSIMVISPRAEQIAPLIMEYFYRGVTFFRGEGAFTRQPKNVMFVVVSLTQVSRIKSIIYALDPTAFIIITDTSEVTGRGFTMKNIIPKEIKQQIEKEEEQY